MMSSWSGIGTSNMNGGAFNWGNLWSNIKNFGSSVKAWGSKAWNSSSGQALRQKLKDSKVQEKIIEGINTGIHGAIDLANQEVQKAIDKRLERPAPVPEVEEELLESKVSPSAPSEVVVEAPAKRPRDEEVLITSTAEPPSYEEAVKNGAAPPPYPTTRPIEPLVRPVLPPGPAAGAVVDVPTTLELKPRDYAVVTPAAPARRPPVLARPPIYAAKRGWESTLSNIVGVGLRGIKRRRCF